MQSTITLCKACARQLGSSSFMRETSGRTRNSGSSQRYFTTTTSLLYPRKVSQIGPFGLNSSRTSTYEDDQTRLELDEKMAEAGGGIQYARNMDGEGDEEAEEYDPEMMRRKRLADAKRRQGVSCYLN
jgi:hypothetical protein